MKFENVRYEVQGPLGLVTIDRADKHNAISLATLDELNAAVDAAAADDAVGSWFVVGD